MDYLKKHFCNIIISIFSPIHMHAVTNSYSIFADILLNMDFSIRILVPNNKISFRETSWAILIWTFFSQFHGTNNFFLKNAEIHCFRHFWNAVTLKSLISIFIDLHGFWLSRKCKNIAFEWDHCTVFVMVMEFHEFEYSGNRMVDSR